MWMLRGARLTGLGWSGIIARHDRFATRQAHRKTPQSGTGRREWRRLSGADSAFDLRERWPSARGDEPADSHARARRSNYAVRICDGARETVLRTADFGIGRGAVAGVENSFGHEYRRAGSGDPQRRPGGAGADSRRWAKDGRTNRGGAARQARGDRRAGRGQAGNEVATGRGRGIGTYQSRLRRQVRG